MERNEIKQVLVEAAEVYEDLEDESPRLDSREAQIALIEYNLREAREGEIEHDIDESGWIARLEQAAKALRAKDISAVVAEARQYVVDCYEDVDEPNLWVEARPEVVLREAVEILQEDLQDGLDPGALRFLADIVEALQALNK